RVLWPPAAMPAALLARAEQPSMAASAVSMPRRVLLLTAQEAMREPPTMPLEALPELTHRRMSLPARAVMPLAAEPVEMHASTVQPAPAAMPVPALPRAMQRRTAEPSPTRIPAARAGEAPEALASAYTPVAEAW